MINPRSHMSGDNWVSLAVTWDQAFTCHEKKHSAIIRGCIYDANTGARCVCWQEVRYNLSGCHRKRLCVQFIAVWLPFDVVRDKVVGARTMRTRQWTTRREQGHLTAFMAIIFNATATRVPFRPEGFKLVYA